MFSERAASWSRPMASQSVVVPVVSGSRSGSQHCFVAVPIAIAVVVVVAVYALFKCFLFAMSGV